MANNKEQLRAVFAYKTPNVFFKDYENENNKDTKTKKLKQLKEYKSHVKSLPMMIKTSGLGSTIAFIFAKKKPEPENPYQSIYNEISEWLVQEKIINNDKTDEFVQKIIKLDSEQYRRATQEVLALLKWSRRFAEGLCPEDNDD